MKTRNPASSYILMFVGGVLMAGFGSEIANSIALPKSWAGHMLLPGYSVGILMICQSYFARLSAQVKDLQSKVDGLERTKS